MTNHPTLSSQYLKYDYCTYLKTKEMMRHVKEAQHGSDVQRSDNRHVFLLDDPNYFLGMVKK